MNCPNCGAPAVGECEYCNTIVPLSQNEDSSASPINVTNANKYNINIHGDNNNVNISNDTYLTVVSGNDNFIETPVAGRSRVYPNGNPNTSVTNDSFNASGCIIPLIILMVVVIAADPRGGIAFFGGIGALVAIGYGIAFLIKSSMCFSVFWNFVRKTIEVIFKIVVVCLLLVMLYGLFYMVMQFRQQL